MFEKFKKNVLDISDTEVLTSRGYVFAQNLKSMRPLAFAVLFLNIYGLLINRFHAEMEISYAPSVIVIVILSLASVYMFILSGRAKKKDEALVRISYIIYYILIIAGVTFLTVSRNISCQTAGVGKQFAGISLSTYLMFLPVFMPLPDALDSVIILIANVAGFFIPIFTPGAEAYSVPTHFVLRACVAAAYVYFRRSMLLSVKQDATLDMLNKRLTDYSYSDPLTGALNRRAMDRYLKYLLKCSRNGQIGVMMFDIDFFKIYNDRYNHVKGDEVLTGICRIAENCLIDENAYLFRYGGEEFVAVIDGCTEEELKAMMQKIRLAIYDENLSRKDISEFDRVTVTIGGAMDSLEKGPNGDYVTAADNQLYLGKKSGKNCAFFGGKEVK